MPGNTAMSSARQASGPAFDGLEYGAGHGEHPRITARDDGDPAARAGETEGVARAVQLGAVVAGVAHLAGTGGQTAEIGTVADQVLGSFKGGGGLRRDEGRVAGTEAEDDETAAHRVPRRPGTSTSEK